MGLFAAYVKPKPTKHNIGCRLASLIRAVIQQDGFEVLLSGRFYMTHDFDLSFGHHLIRNESYEARQYNAAKIPDPKRFRELYADKEIRHFRDSYDGLIDALTFALIEEFHKTSAPFRDLPPVFVDDDGCVVRACTSEYRNAELNDSNQEKVRLVGQYDQSHLYIETSASIGLLKQRAREVAPDFVGGAIYAGPL